MPSPDRRVKDRARRDTLNAAKRERWAARTPEERVATRERRKANRARVHAANVAAWIEEHGPPPACECGCGQPVGFDRHGTPNLYVAGHWVPPSVDAHAVEFQGERVATVRARPALERLRQRHGWTIQEMARRGGVPRGTLWAILRKPGYAAVHGIDAEWLRCLLRRLAGLAVDRPTATENRRSSLAFQSTSVDHYR